MVLVNALGSWVEVIELGVLKMGVHHCTSECQICMRSPQNDMLVQLYAIIWSRNGVGLTCVGPYRHADAVDSVRLTCEVIRMCRYSARGR